MPCNIVFECDMDGAQPRLGRRRVVTVAALSAAAFVAGAVATLPALQAGSSVSLAAADSVATAIRVESWGDDAADGVSAPVRSVARAVKLARAARAASGDAQTVEVGAGTFRLEAKVALGPLDAGLALRGAGASETYLSGGAAVPASCWTDAGGGAWRCDLRGDAGAALRDRGRVDFRSLRIGAGRATPARFPDASADFGDPAQFLYANATAFVASNTWALTLASAVDGGLPVPEWLSAPDWAGASVKAWPAESWNNYEAVLRKPSDQTRAALVKANYSVDQPWYELLCPLAGNDTDSACDGYDGELKQGSRLYVYGTVDALDRDGEWARDGAEDVLYVYDSAGAPTDVFAPLLTTLVEVGPGADGVSLAGLAFVDADYDSYGFQDGFDIDASTVGIPDDVAVRIRGAGDVSIDGCRFEHLGGGGVLATDSADRLAVVNSFFSNLGQSGVMLVGNGTTMPSRATIRGNAMDGIGQVLASAGGVFCCACAHTTIEGNAVTRASRWGVAVRSQSTEAALSHNNSVTWNRLSHLGLASKDFGGISTIAYDGAPRAFSTIAFNRVTDVVGVYSEWDADLGGPVVRAPYMSYGIYLDNEASGYNVSHNVVANTEDASLFFHSGRDNHVANNVFYNASNIFSSAGCQVNIQGITNFSQRNTFERNIVAFGATPTRRLWYSDSLLEIALAVADDNVYFLDEGDAWQFYYNNSDLTYLGNWTAWTAAGYDGRSLRADPGFRDAATLDLCLEDDSPALRLGFDKIPEAVCR